MTELIYRTADVDASAVKELVFADHGRVLVPSGTRCRSGHDHIKPHGRSREWLEVRERAGSPAST